MHYYSGSPWLTIARDQLRISPVVCICFLSILFPMELLARLFGFYTAIGPSGINSVLPQAFECSRTWS